MTPKRKSGKNKGGKKGKGRSNFPKPKKQDGKSPIITKTGHKPISECECCQDVREPTAQFGGIYGETGRGPLETQRR